MPTWPLPAHPAGLHRPAARLPATLAALSRMVQKPPEGPRIANGNRARASAMALQAGTDMACHDFASLDVSQVSQEELDQAARRVLTARVRCACARRGWLVVGWWDAGCS